VSNLHLLVVDDDSPDGTGEVADELAAASPDTIGLPQRNLVGRRLRQVTWCNSAGQVRLPRSGPYADQHRFSGLDIGHFHRSTGYGVCTASRPRTSWCRTPPPKKLGFF
jgi:glycosyltransferase involved in cell wall biosynthesis